MIPLIALWAAVAIAPVSVRGVSVVPIADRTEIVVAVDGTVTWSDFQLRDPARLVIDISGARHQLPQERFPGIDRGGVVSLQVSQYQPDVVRLVVELDTAVAYHIEQGNGELRISFANRAGTFQGWHAGYQAPPAATAAATPPATRRAAAPPRAFSEPPITVSFRDAPILDVLATFADFAGRSIVAGADVTGKVTADIRDQPWDVALQAILHAQGLDIRETESGILRVDALAKMREREVVEDIVTRQFRIRYVSVDSLVGAVKDQLSERGRITSSPNTNTLIISDGRSVIERLEPLIEQLDARTPQVTIAAKLIFVDRTQLEELGIIYDLKDSRGNQLNQITGGYRDTNGNGILEPEEETHDNIVLLGGNSIASLANANVRVARPALQLVTSLLLGRYSLITFLEALQELSLTDIQASPVITTMDNRQARIQVGEETPIRVIDAGSIGAPGTGGAGVAPRATTQMKETGIILEVTPHVTGDQVLLELHAERSNVAAAASDIGFIFQTQESDTQILLQDGETAVIGGLTVIEKTYSRAGIPVLMDLPVIGALFRTTHVRENKQDLLIMVTPHIVREGEA